MDKFLETYDLPNWIKKTEKLSGPTTTNEIKTVILKIPTNKSPVLDGFTGEFYQTFEEELAPVFLKLSPKNSEEGRLPRSSYEASIILII